MASVKIFGSPTSTDMARVLACVFEKDVHFQLVRVDAFHVKEHHFEKLKIQVIRQTTTDTTSTKREREGGGREGGRERERGREGERRRREREGGREGERGREGGREAADVDTMGAPAGLNLSPAIYSF